MASGHQSTTNIVTETRASVCVTVSPASISNAGLSLVRTLGTGDTATLLIGRRRAVTLPIGRGDTELVTQPLAWITSPHHHRALSCCGIFTLCIFELTTVYTSPPFHLSQAVYFIIFTSQSSLCSSHIRLSPAGWSFTMARRGYHCDVMGVFLSHPFFVSSEQQPLAACPATGENIKTESIMSRNITVSGGGG